MTPWEYSPCPAGRDDISIQPISLWKRRTLGGIRLSYLTLLNRGVCIQVSHHQLPLGAREENRHMKAGVTGPIAEVPVPRRQILSSHQFTTCTTSAATIGVVGQGVQASSVSTSSLRLSLLLMGKGSATSSQPILQKKGCSRGAYSPHMGHIY